VDRLMDALGERIPVGDVDGGRRDAVVRHGRVRRLVDEIEVLNVGTDEGWRELGEY
jgi:hypothetical protein